MPLAMRLSKTLLAQILLISTLLGCQSRVQTEVSYPIYNQKPSRVLVYIDHSMSMQGYFNNGLEANKLLNNLNNYLETQSVEVAYFKFSATPQFISSNIQEARTALFADTFFNGQHNEWSASLQSIVDTLAHGEIALVLSDGALSPPPNKTAAQEAADLSALLSRFGKERSNNAGLFHYRLPFTGRYYAQPSDAHIELSNETRNFFLLALGEDAHTGFLTGFIQRDHRPAFHTFFGNAMQNHVLLEPLCAPNLGTDGNVGFNLQTWGPALELDPEALAMGMQHNQQLESFVNDSGTIEVRLALPADSVATPFTYAMSLHLPYAVPYGWQTLNHDAPENPDSLNHGTTYKLGVLTEALEQGFRDQPEWEASIHLSEWPESSLFAWNYVPLWGQRGSAGWTLNVYWKLFWLWLIVPAMLAPLFYHTKSWSYPVRTWRKFLGATVVVTLILSVLALLFSGYPDCQETWLWTDLVKYPLQNALQAALAFIGCSLLLKGTNANFRNVPL